MVLKQQVWCVASYVLREIYQPRSR